VLLLPGESLAFFFAKYNKIIDFIFIREADQALPGPGFDEQPMLVICVVTHCQNVPKAFSRPDSSPFRLHDIAVIDEKDIPCHRMANR